MLDGCDESLTDSERAAVEEIRRLEADVCGRLDTEVPPVVLSRARARLAGALFRRRRIIRLRLFSGVAAAAGLLLVVALGYWAREPVSVPRMPAVTKVPAGPGAAQTWAPDVTSALLRTDRNADLLMLDREMSELETGMMASAPDVELDALERELQDLVVGDGTAVFPPGL
ncbi:MAG: hypothetical protein AMK72_11685 [Planctomycetes bacterium SM23_25]|nr:MAG: hypothetical protein AMK72_11685 [Planctomycetes bacterium SM23_25]